MLSAPRGRRYADLVLAANEMKDERKVCKDRRTVVASTNDTDCSFSTTRSCSVVRMLLSCPSKQALPMSQRPSTSADRLVCVEGQSSERIEGSERQVGQLQGKVVRHGKTTDGHRCLALSPARRVRWRDGR